MMSLKSHLFIAFVISLVFLAGFSIVAIFISDKKIIDFDSDIISVIQGWESPTLTVFMKFFTFIGSAPCVVIISLILLFILYKLLKHRLELILFTSAVVGSAILNGVLKQIFHRVRPDLHRPAPPRVSRRLRPRPVRRSPRKPDSTNHSPRLRRRR